MYLCSKWSKQRVLCGGLAISVCNTVTKLVVPKIYIFLQSCIGVLHLLTITLLVTWITTPQGSGATACACPVKILILLIPHGSIRNEVVRCFLTGCTHSSNWHVISTRSWRTTWTKVLNQTGTRSWRRREPTSQTKQCYRLGCRFRWSGTTSHLQTKQTIILRGYSC